MMMTSLLLVLLVCGTTWAVPIDNRLEEYCKSLLAIYEKNPESPIVQGIIEPWLCRSLDTVEEADFFLPKILIWCPLTRFTLPLKCPTHGNLLRTGMWKVSTKMSAEPRLLFDLDGNTLLIARFYVCSSSGIYHRILSSDQLLLEQMQTDLEIPFILSHRSGYTLRFLTHIRVEIGLGINFNDISQSLMKMNFKNFIKRRNLMLLLYNHNGKQPGPRFVEDKEFHENALYSFPSDDHIREMFLMNFKQTRSIYEGDMKKLSGCSLSMFHSFRVCNKVGAYRSTDSAWVSEHHCLFLVVNEIGEVIKWCFCEGIDFDEIKAVLTELYARFNIQGRQPGHIMVGPCCKWRDQLMGIFGSSIQVKKDLYATTEDLKGKLTMDDVNTKSCLDDFDMVFRSFNDRGIERVLPTPSPDVIKCHLNNFVMKWRSSLNSAVFAQLSELQTHIEFGCLSGIPVGHGSKNNEDLNYLLNKSLVSGASRVGPELAFALITVLFYIINGKLRRKKRLFEIPNNLPPAELDGETFGFLNSLQNQPPLIMPQSNPTVIDMNSGAANIHQLLREDVLQFLVPEALELYDFLQCLHNRCNSTDLNVWDWTSIRPDKALSLLLCRNNLPDEEDESGHFARLADRLEQFNLGIELVEKDGNCAFTSVALQLKPLFLKETEMEYRHYLSSLGIRENQSVVEFSKQLRFMFVKEITTNMTEYYPFTQELTEEMYLDEARSFQFDGVFTSQLGDFIMKALSKVFCCAIVVLTSIPDVEVIPFIPALIKCKTPLFVAYNQKDSGHYDSTLDKNSMDAAIEANGIPVNKYVSTQGKCRCGRGKHANSINFISCTNTVARGKYLTRCPCHRLKQGCTVLCRCLNCGNEFTSEETRADMAVDKPVKRKRHVTASKKRKSGEEFIRELRDQIPTSQTVWSPFESCVFEASLRFLAYSGVEQSTENILLMYNFIAKSTSVTTMGLALRCKTLHQVDCKLHSRQDSVEVLQVNPEVPEPITFTIENTAGDIFNLS